MYFFVRVSSAFLPFASSREKKKIRLFFSGSARNALPPLNRIRGFWFWIKIATRASHFVEREVRRTILFRIIVLENNYIVSYIGAQHQYTYTTYLLSTLLRSSVSLMILSLFLFFFAKTVEHGLQSFSPKKGPSLSFCHNQNNWHHYRVDWKIILSNTWFAMRLALKCLQN